jgi:hypothetical protein
MIWAFITSKVGKALAGALAALAAVGAIFMAGRRAENEDHEIEELNEFVATQKRINDVDESTSYTAALERLRRNAQLRD